MKPEVEDKTGTLPSWLHRKTPLVSYVLEQAMIWDTSRTELFSLGQKKIKLVTLMT